MTTVYATWPELSDFTGGQYSAVRIINAEMALEAASRDIDRTCRQFFYDTEMATARTFRVEDSYSVTIDPFHTTTGLVIETDSAGDGTYATAWAPNDYELERFGGSMADALGAPYDTLHGGVGTLTFGSYTSSRRQFPLQVTARWGWATVPVPVKRACLVLAAEMMKDPNTPFGVAGFDQFGAVRVRANPRVERALAPYIRWDRFGIA